MTAEQHQELKTYILNAPIRDELLLNIDLNTVNFTMTSGNSTAINIPPSERRYAPIIKKEDPKKHHKKYINKLNHKRIF